MKKTWLQAKIIIPLLIVFVCLAIYAALGPLPRSIITGLIEVPICKAKIRHQLNIESGTGTITSYVMSTLRPGMTRAEVENTLSKIAPIDVDPSAFSDDIYEIYIKTCSNSWGNVMLLVYYSPEGFLEKVENAFAD